VTSRYVVFQYLPDPATDERINFGVATHDDEGFYARFLHDWRRVKSFGGADVTFLQQFARRVEASGGLPSLFSDADADARLFFDEAPIAWINTIQVTRPRASTRSASELLDYVARRFLRVSVRRRRGKDRRWMRAVTHEIVVSALETAGVYNADEIVRSRVSVDGEVESHEFDLTIQNAQLALAALALSFQKQSARELQREYASAAWALEDVHKRDPDVPLAVVMMPPARGTSKTYEQARHVFEALEARAVSEPELDEWAAEVAESVVASNGMGPTGPTPLS
jgi:hypothetical protein